MPRYSSDPAPELRTNWCGSWNPQRIKCAGTPENDCSRMILPHPNHRRVRCWGCQPEYWNIKRREQRRLERENRPKQVGCIDCGRSRELKFDRPQPEKSSTRCPDCRKKRRSNLRSINNRWLHGQDVQDGKVKQRGCLDCGGPRQRMPGRGGRVSSDPLCQDCQERHAKEERTRIARERRASAKPRPKQAKADTTASEADDSGAGVALNYPTRILRAAMGLWRKVFSWKTRRAGP